MHSYVPLFFPPPQQVEHIPERFTVPKDPVIHVESEPSPATATLERLFSALETSGFRPRSSETATEAHIALRVHPAALPTPQSYRLQIDGGGIRVLGADEAGLFYGVCTFVQLIHLLKPETPREPLTLPGLLITDWPDFPHRGVLLDVSRDKVPAMDTLYALADLLASWKINQLQLYMEHTFAYRGHEAVWRHASPLTGEEIEALDAFCRKRFVELVPNQNSFGHMHRWLIHDPYRQLAECPDGIVHPFSPSREPYGLCPVDPGSLALLADLYGQLLPHFSSRQFNVGLDETFDLGHGRSAALCAEKGQARVYLDFLQQVHRLVTRHGYTMQCWGDMLHQHPELIGELPNDLIILEWGYEANHAFVEHSRFYAAAGLRVYICPGTSSWNSLAGRTENALANILSAAKAGRAIGAIGLLTTDWGDNGHLQPLPVSYLGLMAGAAASWCSTDAPDRQRDMPTLLDVHAFRDQAGVMGQLSYDLGNAYQRTGVTLHNGSALFRLLVFADDGPLQPELEGSTIESLERTLAYIDEVTAPLPKARMARPDAEIILSEFRWVADMLRLACRLGIARLSCGSQIPISALPVQTRIPLADDLRVLIEQHRELWLRRNRPGGLNDSTGRLQRILKLLEG